MSADVLSIYVGTYGKYNNGDLSGKWLNLHDYSNYDEFLDACKELHKDEPDPEFMFQDWNLIPSCLISESWIIHDIFEHVSDIENNVDAYFDFCELYYSNDIMETTSELVNAFNDAFYGEWDSEEEFAENMVNECGYLDQMPGHLRCYFDYSAFARDLFFDYYYSDHGFVFRR